MALWILIPALCTLPRCGSLTHQGKKDGKEETIQEKSGSYSAVNPSRVKDRLKRLAAFELRYDEATLTRGEKALLEKIPEIGRRIDEVYLEQSLAGNVEIFNALRKQLSTRPTAANRRLLETYWINKGPYDFEDHAPVVQGPGDRVFPPLYPGRNFYPEGLTAEEFNDWVQGLDAEAAAAARSDFTMIRRDTGGGLESVPYSEAYRDRLVPLAAALRRAAGDVAGTKLAEYLKTRADALVKTNDYEASEGLWISLNGPDDHSGGHLDITIGPYENYADELMKRKAAFQLYVGVLRPAETEALKFYSKHIHKMDDRLWDLYQTYVKEQREVAPGKRLQAGEVRRWSKPGARLTLVAVDLAYSAGYGNEGVQTLAFNLPNVTSWQEKFGSKKVMLMNLLEGKFLHILKPISAVVMDPAELPNVDQYMFSDNTVRHEISHGIGPSGIFVGGKKTTVRERHQKYYSPFEEAKAETVSLLFGFHLASQGLLTCSGPPGVWVLRDFDVELACQPAIVDIVEDSTARKMTATYTASTFRTVRFGATSDHARGKVFEFNRLVQNGGIVVRDGKIAVDHEKFRGAVEKLVMEILDLQMRGTSEEAKKLLETVGTPTEALTRGLEAIEKADIPMDLRVRYAFGKNYGVITGK